MNPQDPREVSRPGSLIIPLLSGIALVISFLSPSTHIICPIPLSKFFLLLRKLYKSLSANPADDCSYWIYDLWPQSKAKAFLSPAPLEVTGLTGKEKFQNVSPWSWSIFLLGSSLRTLRPLREKISFIFLFSSRGNIFQGIKRLWFLPGW